jgi:hypothetical protein
MHARVVRFTDVSAERVSELVAEIEGDGGPPPGVEMSGLELFFDASQGTAIFVGYFDSEQQMQDSSAAFEEMDPSETPGTRASVDLCEIKLQRRFG